MCLRSSQSRWHLAILLLEQACRAVAKTSIAGWEGLRGAQLQETLVLEGGLMTNGTFSNGKWSDTGIVQHSYGVYYQIDLTASFDATVQDTTEYLKAGLPETSNTQAPNYVAGGLFQNVSDRCQRACIAQLADFATGLSVLYVWWAGR